jgi:hypothetical protein
VTPQEGDVMRPRTARELLQAASEAAEARDDDELLRWLHQVSHLLFSSCSYFCAVILILFCWARDEPLSRLQLGAAGEAAQFVALMRQRGANAPTQVLVGCCEGLIWALLRVI